MRKWMGIPLALLLIIGLHASAWANSELHTGGRLFFPLWDVSTPNRVTFIIVTRVAMREGASFEQDQDGQWLISGNPGKCLPRGPGDSTPKNVNRTDLGGTSTDPVFVDDVHFEYYGRTCIKAHEIVHMSCGDTDLFLLSSAAPRSLFALVAGDLRGALDVHLITNGSADPTQRKVENSLMGRAIISDLAEGWAASYDAAPAKAVPCSTCADIDDGTEVGYENYPMEVYLPFALADGFPTDGGDLQNRLSLWAPALMPGGLMTEFSVEFKLWDGRERFFVGDRRDHSINERLSNVDIRFDVANFVCGHTSNPGKAENDGFPRIARKGGGAIGCDGPAAPDPSHKSDNFDDQPSTPMGWWRFQMRGDGEPPVPLSEDSNFNHSGRGLVGVVLSTPVVKKRGKNPFGTGDATRLWHEDPCEIAQSGQTIGPPHDRDRLIFKAAGDDEDFVALFNALNFDRQELLCAGRP